MYNQRQILVDYAEQQGYEIVGESSDDNVSGMTFERKGLAELENPVDEDKVDVVLVKDLSRLADTERRQHSSLTTCVRTMCECIPSLRASTASMTTTICSSA